MAGQSGGRAASALPACLNSCLARWTQDFLEGADSPLLRLREWYEALSAHDVVEALPLRFGLAPFLCPLLAAALLREA